MSAVRQMARRKARAASRAAAQAGPGPYRIRAVQIVVELEFFDPATGKVKDRKATEPAAVYETDFWPGLYDWLTAKGLSPVVDETPASPAKKEAKSA